MQRKEKAENASASPLSVLVKTSLDQSESGDNSCSDEDDAVAGSTNNSSNSSSSVNKRSKKRPASNDLATIQRRKKHNEVEVRRRQRLNERFAQLRQLGDCKSSNKIQILTAAIEKLQYYADLHSKGSSSTQSSAMATSLPVSHSNLNKPMAASLPFALNPSMMAQMVPTGLQTARAITLPQLVPPAPPFSVGTPTDTKDPDPSSVFPTIKTERSANLTPPPPPHPPGSTFPVVPFPRVGPFSSQALSSFPDANSIYSMYGSYPPVPFTQALSGHSSAFSSVPKPTDTDAKESNSSRISDGNKSPATPVPSRTEAIPESPCEKKPKSHCLICFCNERDVLFLPCGHTKYCSKCVNSLGDSLKGCSECGTSAGKTLKILTAGGQDDTAKPSLHSKCIMCEENDRDVALTPCGHLLYCSSCISRAKKCPSCFQTIESRVSVKL